MSGYNRRISAQCYGIHYYRYNAQLEVEINCDNIRCASFEFPQPIVNDEEIDIVSNMDINETNVSVTLNQKFVY
jgi:hypothetical protein